MVVNMDEFEKIEDGLTRDVWRDVKKHCSYLVADKKMNVLETIHFEENKLRPGIHNRDLAVILLDRYQNERNEEQTGRMKRVLGEMPRKRGPNKAVP